MSACDTVTTRQSKRTRKPRRVYPPAARLSSPRKFEPNAPLRQMTYICVDQRQGEVETTLGHVLYRARDLPQNNSQHYLCRLKYQNSRWDPKSFCMKKLPGIYSFNRPHDSSNRLVAASFQNVVQHCPVHGLVFGGHKRRRRQGR